MGLAVLPCYLADAEPAVHSILPPIAPLTRELWLVSHQDLRQTARIRAFFEFIPERRPGERFFAAAPTP